MREGGPRPTSAVSNQRRFANQSLRYSLLPNARACHILTPLALNDGVETKGWRQVRAGEVPRKSAETRCRVFFLPMSDLLSDPLRLTRETLSSQAKRSCITKTKAGVGASNAAMPVRARHNRYDGRMGPHGTRSPSDRRVVTTRPPGRHGRSQRTGRNPFDHKQRTPIALQDVDASRAAALDNTSNPVHQPHLVPETSNGWCGCLGDVSIRIGGPKLGHGNANATERGLATQQELLANVAV